MWIKEINLNQPYEAMEKCLPETTVEKALQLYVPCYKYLKAVDLDTKGVDS